MKKEEDVMIVAFCIFGFFLVYPSAIGVYVVYDYVLEVKKERKSALRNAKAASEAAFEFLWSTHTGILTKYSRSLRLLVILCDQENKKYIHDYVF